MSNPFLEGMRKRGEDIDWMILMRLLGFTEADLVTQIANSLPCSEFDVFMDAYEMFNEPMTEERCNKVFVDYILNEEVPWRVTQYCRVKLND